jgi:hypothetical protein
MKRFETVIKTNAFVGKDFVQVMKEINNKDYYEISLKHFDPATGYGSVCIEEFIYIIDKNGEKQEAQNTHVIWFDDYVCFESFWEETRDYDEIYED